jgi:uncharacterized membrane protein HdeD (DUF308 family)
MKKTPTWAIVSYFVAAALFFVVFITQRTFGSNWLFLVAGILSAVAGVVLIVQRQNIKP